MVGLAVTNKMQNDINIVVNVSELQIPAILTT